MAQQSGRTSPSLPGFIPGVWNRATKHDNPRFNERPGLLMIELSGSLAMRTRRRQDRVLAMMTGQPTQAPSALNARFDANRVLSAGHGPNSEVQMV